MTYIYQELSTNEIARQLRADEYGGWTGPAAWAMAEYLEQLAEDTGEPIELDIVAIRCDFSEYKNFEEVAKEYDDIKTLDDLRDHTTVIEFDGGLIVQGF